MKEDEAVDAMKEGSKKDGKDDHTRTLLKVFAVIWALSILLFLWYWGSAFLDEKSKSQTLAQQITLACKNGDFGLGFSQQDKDALCSNAKKVVQNKSDLQDKEIQEPEIQDPETQDPEIQDPENQNSEHQDHEAQDPEIQDPEDQNPEIQDEETQDPETQDDETQDPEVQDEETQDPEIQDPEINDPDPNDQITAGTCTFDGVGTITFTFQTTSGPVDVTCTGTAVATAP